MVTEISQAAAQIPALSWTAGDPVSLSFRVDADWSGNYSCQIRESRSPTAELVGELAVLAEWDTPAYPDQTLFTLSMVEADSLEVAPGSYFCDIQMTGGVTRVWAKVKVGPQVTTFP